MSGVGTMYDLSAGTYSPDGRVFQVEYANKAVEKSGTVVGIRTKDGVVLGVEKIILSKMLVAGANRRIQHVDKHCGMAVTGLVADARQLVNFARKEAKEYRNFYGEPVPVDILNEKVSGQVQYYTLYSWARPYGCDLVIAGYDSDGPKLFKIDPSGTSWGYYGVAAGKGKAAAKTELEKLKLKELTTEQAVIEVAKIIYAVHDDVKDKDFELELSWISPATNYEHTFVPKELREKAIAAAKAALEEEEEEEEEDAEMGS